LASRCGLLLYIACAVVAAAAVLALLASSGPASAENLNLTVPYHQQEEGWYCAEACLEMVFDYWGEDIPQDDIGDVANETPAGGTYASDLMRAAEFSDMSNAVQQREAGGPSLRGYEQRSMGYGAYERNWEYGSYYWVRFDQLEQCLREGFPVIMLVWYDSSMASRHFVVLKGFDDANLTFTVHDPARGPDRVRGMYVLDELWTCSDRWAMVVAPWSVRLECPAMVGPGMGFDLTARVEALCPTPLRSVQSGYRWYSSPSASLLLPYEIEPVYGESMVKDMSFDGAGVPESVAWGLTVPHQEGLLTCNLRVDAEVIVHGSSEAYPYYSDVVGTSVSVTVVVDCAHPSIDSMVLEGGVSAVADPWVLLAYRVSDEGGGVDAVAFTVNGSTGWGPWGAANGTMRILLDRGDGGYRVGMRVRDVFGNAALDYRDIVLDTVPPVMVSFVVAGGQALVTTGDIDAQINATDHGSGLRQMRFRFDGAPWMPWRPFQSDVGLAVPHDGPVTIEVMVVDGAGLAAGASATLTIDATPPTITTFEVAGGARFLRGGTVDLLINASDNVATSIEWAIVCGTAPSPAFDPSWTLPSGNLTRMPWTFPGEGRFVLTLFVRDEAGFTAGSSIDAVVDGTPPTASLEVDEGRALTNATVVSVKWLAVDAVSGLKGASLRVDAGQWRALGDMWEPVSVDLGDREGPRSIELMAEDLAGNLGKAVATIVVDTRAPTAEMHPTGELADGTVAVDTRFWVEFSEPMERASVRAVLLNGTRMNVDCTIEWLNGTSGIEVRPLRSLSFSEGYTLEVVGRDPAGNALDFKRATVLTGAAPPPPGLVVGGGGVPLALLVILLVAATAVVALAAMRRRRSGGGREGQAASSTRRDTPPAGPMGKV
jgi:hypothetical protein